MGLRYRRLLTTLNGAAPSLKLTATTAGPGNVTIHQMTPAAGTTLLIDWGDGSATTVAAGDVANQVHAYAGAGTWAIRITDPRNIVAVYFADAQLSGLHSKELSQSAIAEFTCFGIGNDAANVFSSADMVAWPLTIFQMFSMPAGTYTINSADMTGFGLLNTFFLYMPAGTYTIDSSDYSGFPLITFVMFAMPAGGAYTISTADMATWGASLSTAQVYSMNAASTTWTIAANDLAPLVNCSTFRLSNNGFNEAQVDALLWGMYQASVAPRVAAAGAINLADNAAPSGVFQAAGACPVSAATDGKEVAHELLNDTCAEGFNVWATVTTT